MPYLCSVIYTLLRLTLDHLCNFRRYIWINLKHGEHNKAQHNHKSRVTVPPLKKHKELIVFLLLFFFSFTFGSARWLKQRPPLTLKAVLHWTKSSQHADSFCSVYWQQSKKACTQACCVYAVLMSLLNNSIESKSNTFIMHLVVEDFVYLQCCTPSASGGREITEKKQKLKDTLCESVYNLWREADWQTESIIHWFLYI